MRKMGKTWTSLHKWVYLAGILAVLHYLLLVKNAYTLPVIYGTVLAILLLSRIKPLKTRIISWRRGLEKERSRRLRSEKSQISPS
jgi:sulfoxide reductase heme-binding subunit YedZ